VLRCLGGLGGTTSDRKGTGVSDERHFGKRLREARLSAGLSQSDLEDISGIPKARLSRYENGHVEPSIQTLNRLARALNVSEASLLGDERAALEEFEAVLRERGISLKSKEQARQLAESFASSIRGGSLAGV
jgi:transcriptional regulator with XRE-family HTH domain